MSQIDDLRAFAMGLYLRHSNCRTKAISPNEKTSIENNILTVINWCKNQRDELTRLRKETNDPDLQLDHSIEVICQELQTMLETAVQSLLEEIEMRDDADEEVPLPRSPVKALGSPIKAVHVSHLKQDSIHTDETTEEEEVVLGTSAVALASNVVVIRKKAVQRDSELFDLYERLVELITEQMKSNHTVNEKHMVDKQLQKIVTYASRHKTDSAMMQVVINLVKLALHCLSYCSKRIITATKAYQFMNVPDSFIETLQSNINWKEAALESLEKYRSQKLTNAEMIDRVLEPIVSELQELLDSIHAQLFELFYSKCFNFLKRNDHVNNGCNIETERDHITWTSKHSFTHVTDVLLRVWEQVLLPFYERDQTMTCEYPLTVSQILHHHAQLEKLFLENKYIK